MASQWRKRLIITALLAVGAGILFWALRPQPVPVDIAVIERGRLTVTVSEEGTTRVRDIYTISAPISGTLQRSPREVGDRVTAGETPVAVLLPAAPAFLDARARREAEAAVTVAEATVRVAEVQVRETEAQLSHAESEYTRAIQLQRRGVVPQRTLDDARIAVSNAEARLFSAEAELEMRRRELETARARLTGPEAPVIVGSADPEGCCIVVRAPVNGRVLSIFHESERVVEAGAPLLEIGDPTELEVVAEVLSSDAVRIEEGAPATIEGWGHDEELRATVRRIDPAGFTKVSALGIEEQRVRAVLDIDDPPERWKRLGHGYRVNVRIHVEDIENAILVPLSALFRRGDAWQVFVVDDRSRAQTRRVEIGSRTHREAVIVDGLAPGDRVISHPSDRVADDVRVAPRS